VASNWIPGARFLTRIERRLEAGGSAVEVQSAPRPSRRNYDGEKLSLGEVLQRCRTAGNDIYVGHTGGEIDLRRRGLAYAQTKPWKVRTASTPGVMVAKNWIRGKRFLSIIEELLAR